MAKKKSNGLDLGKILYYVAVVLGVVAVAMIFVASVKTPDVEVLNKVVEGESVTGLQVAFGYSENDVANLSFSFMALLPFVLALAGTVLTALNAFGKKGSKIFDFVSIGAFVVAGVLFFLMPSFMVFAETLAGAVLEAFEWKLAIGSIIAAVCSILAGAAVLVKGLMKK